MSKKKKDIPGYEELNDISPRTKKKRDWQGAKIRNGILEKGYNALANGAYDLKDYDSYNYYHRKAFRLHECGKKLIFNEHLVCEGCKELRAKKINSCHVRLCPVCNRRRSSRLYSQMKRIFRALQLQQERQRSRYAYIFVTLTVPNVTGEELSSKITEIFEAFHNKFMKSKWFKQTVKGGCRILEVSHNVSYYSRSYNTYHPHIHCIFVVDRNYFHSKNYINHDELLSMWREAMGDASITQVDVRRVKCEEADDIVSAICEVAKYTVKDTDYIIPEDWDLTCISIDVLDYALANRRLVSFFGVMRKLHKELNLDDPIDGDLLKVGDEEGGIVDESFIRERTFFWHWGYQQYYGKK